MALPKRKHSHSRTRKRRTHQKLEIPRLSVCPECKNLRITHRVCPMCGFYKGKEVVRIEIKQKKKPNK